MLDERKQKILQAVIQNYISSAEPVGSRTLARKYDLGVSPATITKMGKNGHVTTEVLLKICTALDCKIDDVMEIVPDSSASVNK